MCALHAPNSTTKRMRPSPVPSSLYHPSTASVPTSYYSMWHYKGLNRGSVASQRDDAIRAVDLGHARLIRGPLAKSTEASVEDTADILRVRLRRVYASTLSCRRYCAWSSPRPTRRCWPNRNRFIINTIISSSSNSSCRRRRQCRH